MSGNVPSVPGFPRLKDAPPARAGVAGRDHGDAFAADHGYKLEFFTAEARTADASCCLPIDSRKFAKKS